MIQRQTKNSTAALPPEVQPELSPPVRTVLSAVRRRIRRYVWAEGVTSAVAWLGVAFWGSLALDWFFEPSANFRAVILAIVGMVFVGILLRLVAMRAFVPLSDSSMATLLERRFPHLNDTLLTAVLLTQRERAERESPDREGEATASCDPRMLARTCREATRRIERVEVGRVFNPTPLRRSTAAALLLAISVGLFAFQANEAFGVWVKRTLQLDAALWPRDSRLAVEGFDGGTRKVARGSDLEIPVKAHMAEETSPPNVQLRYRTDGGTRRRATMDRLGMATPNTDTYQHYSHTFQGILTDMRFDVIGGDDRIDDLRIEVVDSPTIVEMSLECKYPAYMARSPKTLPMTSLVEIERGTEVTIRGRANKKLAGLRIDVIVGEKAMPARLVGAKELADDPQGFSHTLAPLDIDTTVQFTLTDTDGITSREPVSVQVLAVADEPPKIDARLAGIGSAVTPGARLPVTGRVTDDHGVADVWFDYTIDEGESTKDPIAASDGSSTDRQLNAVMDLADLGLSADQKLLLGVEAADRHDLDDGPNVGRSQRWMLDIVTAEQLRILLEARELVLRQRFERIIEEVTETRDLLIRLEFAPAEEAPATTDGTSSDEEEGTTTTSAAEPGDDTSEPKEQDELSRRETRQRELDLRKLRVQRALQDGRKNSHETAGVADAFNDILLQLVNNRIDTEQLKTRLDEQIAGPLHRIVDTDFSELERRLNRLSGTVGDDLRGGERLGSERLGDEQRDLALAKSEEIILSMRRILDRMLELEDFNEAVELLREIIKLQEELGDETKQRRKDKLRELLGD